jgi:hypothetical protein
MAENCLNPVVFIPAYTSEGCLLKEQTGLAQPSSSPNRIKTKAGPQVKNCFRSRPLTLILFPGGERRLCSHATAH